MKKKAPSALVRNSPLVIAAALLVFAGAVLAFTGDYSDDGVAGWVVNSALDFAGIPYSPVISCTDTDGIDTSVRGMATVVMQSAPGVAYETTSFTDRCLNIRTLVEYHCPTPTSRHEARLITCPERCVQSTCR